MNKYIKNKRFSLYKHSLKDSVVFMNIKDKRKHFLGKSRRMNITYNKSYYPLKCFCILKQQIYEIYFKATMVYSDFKIINNSFLKEFVVNKTSRDQFKAHLYEPCLCRIGMHVYCATKFRNILKLTFTILGMVDHIRVFFLHFVL